MSVLEEAMKVTGQERPKDYVNPFDDFTATGRIWAAMIRVRFGIELDLTPEFVGLMMAAMKISREAGRHKHDNLVDIAGYAECIGKVIDEKYARDFERKTPPHLGQKWGIAAPSEGRSTPTPGTHHHV